jgi:probable rRNA maturation factor
MLRSSVSGAVLELELIGARAVAQAPDLTATERLVTAALASAGVTDGHLAVQYVDEARIAQLNAEYRGKARPTDVLSFPIDGSADVAGGQRELGDIVICAEHTADIPEAIVHATLHLVGMDHETDNGEMLAAQRRVLRSLGFGEGTH